MAKAKETNVMGNYIPKADEYKAMIWCVNNGIKIAPKASIKSTKLWYVTIDIKSKIVTSPVSYGPMDIWKKIFELYKFYYGKNKDNV